MSNSSVLRSASIAQFYANKNIFITGATGEQLIDGGKKSKKREIIFFVTSL